MSKAAAVYLGTSGWIYTDWKERFYPAKLPSKERLSFYSRSFGTTEINSSFYHIPRPATFHSWAAQVPEGFMFAVKVHRSITHVRRLKNAAEIWQEFLDNARELGAKLGPFLFQLPPSLRADADLLESVLASIRRKSPAVALRVAFEFRHASWFDSGILDLLRAYGACLVRAHSVRYPMAPDEATADFVYLRLHGPREMFASTYLMSELKPWARSIRSWLNKGQDVFIYFNNDFQAGAVENALALASMLSKQGINPIGVRPQLPDLGE
jgi:uncharacterized protein YecE (DUF72 family)